MAAPRLTLLVVLLCGSVAAADRLLKPIPTGGAGQAVNGLRASVAPIKREFGPGESIILNWKLFNDSGKAVTLFFDKNKRRLGNFDFQLQKDGAAFAAKRDTAPFAADESEMLIVDSGESVARLIDLRAANWADATALDGVATYKVKVALKLPDGKALETGWADFQITQPGDPRPVLDPELAEKITTLIARVSDIDERVRQDAANDLTNLGKPALGPLNDALARTGNGDVKQRLQRIVETINARINPPPPPPPVPQPQPPIFRPRPGPIERPPVPAPQPPAPPPGPNPGEF